MNRLWKLANKKKKLKKKLAKINTRINVINQEALTYAGVSNRQDLFIACLVNDLHFETESAKPKVDSG